MTLFRIVILSLLFILILILIIAHSNKSKEKSSYRFEKSKPIYRKRFVDRITTTTTQDSQNNNNNPSCYELFLDSRIPILKRLQLGTFVIWKSDNQYHIDHVYDILQDMIQDNRNSLQIRMNVIDMLLRSNNSKYIEFAQHFLQRLRNEERHIDENSLRIRLQQVYDEWQEEDNEELQQVLLDQYQRLETQIENLEKRKPTVYNDSQNVHNHEINNSVLQSSKNLLSYDDANIDLHVEFQRVCPEFYDENKTIIRESIERIQNDKAKFKDNITLSQVFRKINGIITESSRHKDELLIRLAQELVDMHQLCSTGHLSRLINVLQGFEDIPSEFRIEINPKDEIYATISTYITSEIQKSDDADHLLADMTSSEKKDFLTFLNGIMKSKYEELATEYNGILSDQKLKTYVNDAIRTYLQYDKDII